MSKLTRVDLAGVGELPEKGFIVRSHGELQILLARFKGEVFAVENLCSHAFARFDDGRLRGMRLMCPLHGACFDIRDGSVLGKPASAPIQSFAVTLDGDRVLVDLPEAAECKPD